MTEEQVVDSEKGLTAWNRMTGINAIRLEETKDMPREDWLEMRKRGIGGSDISAIAGLNPFKSAIDVFLEKTGKKEPEKENSRMRWGKILEEPVADEYAVVTGNAIQKVNAVLQHPDIPYALANLDRIFRTQTGTRGILEVKTTGWAQGWEDNQIPDFVYCQDMWYLAVTGMQETHNAVLINGNDFRCPPSPPSVKRDENVIKNLLLMADRFWTMNVLKNTPPDPDRSTATKDAYKLLYPNIEEQTIILPNELMEEIKLYVQFNEEIKNMQADKAFIASKILAQMKTAKWATLGEFKATRISKTNDTIDKELLKTKYPEIYSEVVKYNETVYPMIKRVKQKQLTNQEQF